MFRLKKKLILLFLIIFLGGFLRFYRLTEFPIHLNHDEISQLYDAISVAQTGRDIYGNLLPLIFQSTNDFKPPFYTYLTSLFYYFLGGGELTIRLPGAIFSILIIPAIYTFTLKLFKKWQIALLASLITAISPFEIFFGRKSFENGAGIFLMLLGFSFLLNYFEEKKRKLLLVGVTLLGLASYTYFSHAIIIPILIVSTILIYRKYFPKVGFIGLILFFIILSPLAIIVLTNSSVRFRSQSVAIIQDVKLGEEIGIANKYKAILDFSFNRYLNQFNPSYIFGSGLDLTRQGPLGMGLLLYIQIPFLLYGLYHLIKFPEQIEQKKFILAWIIIGMLPSGFTFEANSPHRTIMVFTMLNILTAVGLYQSLLLSKKVKLISFLIMVIFITNFLYFIHLYFVNFPYEKSHSLHYPFKQVAQFAWLHYNEFDHIIFDPEFGDTAPTIGTAAHYYLAYYGNYPPAKFQREYKVGSKPREIIFDKFSIRKLNYLEDQNLKNTLIIASHWSLPIQSIDKGKIMHTFYFYNKQPAFYAIKL